MHFGNGKPQAVGFAAAVFARREHLTNEPLVNRKS
jgi:hypothetical protein